MDGSGPGVVTSTGVCVCVLGWCVLVRVRICRADVPHLSHPLATPHQHASAARLSRVSASNTGTLDMATERQSGKELLQVGGWGFGSGILKG
jgi:hypothetical protein